MREPASPPGRCAGRLAGGESPFSRPGKLMMSVWWLAGLLLVPIQVPRPSSAEETARALHEAYRSIRDREAADLKSLAEQRDKAGNAPAAASVRARLPRPAPPDGPTR